MQIFLFNPVSIKRSLTQKLFSLVCFFFLAMALKSQAIMDIANTAMAEKVYLQTDNTVYTTGQTIWFKAIVVNAGTHKLSQLSGVLYTELVDQDEKIAEKKLIKLDQGTGHGFFQLNLNTKPGTYLLRAYTEWNKNFGNDFIASTYIRVYRDDAMVSANPLSGVKIVEGAGDDRHLQITINRFVLDNSTGKELTIFITVDEKKDTLLVKRNRDGEYLADYPLPPDSRIADIRIQTSNQENYSRTFTLDQDFIDFRIFPESGEWVQDLPSKLGIKALGFNGRGIAVQGEIVNDKGNVIAPFKTNQLGMGTAWISQADSNEKYRAILRTVRGQAIEKEFELPPVAAKGNILQITRQANNIFLEVSSNYLINDSVIVGASCRGLVYFDVKGKLKNGKLLFSLSPQLLPEGVIDFTLMDSSGTARASRLFFNERPGTRIQLSASTVKQEYFNREQTTLVINTSDSGHQPIPSNISVMVFNKTKRGNLPLTRQNILSNFLLSSDLKGRIENPAYYFENETYRFEELDALLLTQGWQRIIYSKKATELLYAPEQVLALSGTVKGGLLNKTTKRETALTMLTFGKIPSAQTTFADSLGRFAFLLNEEYGQNLNVVIQTANKSGKQKPYSIVLDKNQSPAIVYNHAESVELADSIEQAYIKNSFRDKKAEDAWQAAYEGITLQDVTVKAYKLSPERKLVRDKYGLPKTVIEGDAIREKEAKWSYGLYSVLLFNFPDKVRVERAMDGILYARLFNSELTLVVVDGVPVMPENYGLIPSIPPSEVKSFEIIEYAQNFISLFCEVFPLSCRIAPLTGNVIAIYTYGGKGILGANPAVGIVKATVPVFAAPREFYNPKYSNLPSADSLKPDLRTLIFWEPKAKTDSNGKATISFFNADNPGTMQVIIEAISENGSIGYHEIFYEVKKRPAQGEIKR